MAELLVALVPLLLVDVLNPVLFALLVFAAGTSRPVANSSALLVGHTVAYFAAGIVVAIGIEQFAERLANPKNIDFVVSFLVGMLCLWSVLPAKKTSGSEQKEPEWELTPLKCLGFGAAVNFIGVPFALPYFAAVGQILKADLSMQSSLTMLAIYNLAYVLPFTLVPILVALFGDRSKPMLERINAVLVRLAGIAMPWLIGLVGIALIADAILYFTTGKPLW